MADHPLRPATHRRPGRPLPHQLANRTHPCLRPSACTQRPTFLVSLTKTSTCGIQPPFEGLSPSLSPVRYALLTRLPCYSHPKRPFRIRLACVKHAASVRSEPGSNSPLDLSLVATGLTLSVTRQPVLLSRFPKNPRGYSVVLSFSTIQRTILLYLLIYKQKHLLSRAIFYFLRCH